MTISSPFDLNNLDGENGFTIINEPLGNFDAYTGESLSEAGDINGDGFDDLIIGTVGIRPIVEPNPDDIYSYSTEFTRTGYVVFGSDDGFDPELNLAELDGSDGFVLTGDVNAFNGPSLVVSDAGDFNGDGIDDVIIGSGSYNDINQVFIVFGREGGFEAELDLLELDSESGLTINNTGFIDSVEGAGDINGDGLDDLLVDTQGGYSYVIFGDEDSTNPNLTPSDLDGTNGFIIENTSSGTNGIGDFNGDGTSDFFLNTSDDDFIVLGGNHSNSFGANLDPEELDESNSIRTGNDVFVFEVGDVNNDGLDDIGIVVSSDENDGVVQIIFGSSDLSSFDEGIDLTNLDENAGFQISGLTDSSLSVDSAGDFNGDGVNDFIIASSFISAEFGASYVIFGQEGNAQTDINISDIDSSNGFVIPDVSIASGAGDLNNDGVDDIVTGNDDNNFVIFGQADDADPGQPDPQPPVLNFDSRIFATEGADEIALGGVGQVAFGLDGDDVIDFRFDSGANRAFGGDGDDTFFLGSADRVFGVDGNDTFIVSTGGGNVITGNRGDDRFIIADGVIPDSTNTITDFVTGSDSLVIQNLDASFEDLSFRDSADGAIIALNGDDLVVLTNRNANFIANPDNFVFVDSTPELPEFTQVFANDGGNNILAEGSNQVFFGLAGDDVIDFRNDTGANRAFGGDGDDVFLSGSGDRIFGVDGNDRFFLGSGGGNVITGNRGADQYIIDGVIPEVANTITDFVVGDDLLVIQGLGASFSDLSFSDSADGAIVSINGSELAILTNRSANFITNEDNFDFVA